MRKVPKLRFKEFSDELNNYHFIDIGKVKIGLTHTPKYVEKGIPFLSSKNISKGYIDFDEVQYISKEEFESMPKSTKPQKGDILFTRVGSNLGNPIVLEEEKEVGIFVSLGAIKVNKNFNNFYIKYWIDTNYFWKQVEMKVAGGAKNNLNTTWLNEFKLSTPSLQEQEKIANFLSSIDKKISLTEEKLELFREYKKGVMQKIFSQELRFKDNNGNDYPEWEEKKLGDILEEYNEKTTINNQYLTLSSTATGIYLQEEYFNRQIASTNNIGYKILKKDQLVFSPQNLWLGNININTKYDIGMVSPSYKIFNLKNNIILVNYFKNLIRTPKMLEEYKNASEQGASIVRRNLDMNQFNNIYIQLPCYEEQQKIADFLSSIDNKIESIEKELEGLKEFKKGLLQQMFV